MTLLKMLARSGLILWALAASAQDAPRPASPSPEKSAAKKDGRVLYRVQNDLDRATAGTPRFSGDRDRLTVAREDVNECQRGILAGTYDRRTFGETLAAIERVIDLNSLPDANRDSLVQDMKALRDLQARLER
jgi:hypothetical protein